MSNIGRVTQADPPRKPLQVLVYSDDRNTRDQVLLALGPRPHLDLPPFEYVEVATEPMVIAHMDTGTVDLAILDGEAVPAGGNGHGGAAQRAAGTRSRSRPMTTSASWIGSRGYSTAASARDHVASQASWARPISTSSGGQS